MNYKKISQQQEKRVAKDLSGRVVIASGAFWNNKGDVRNDYFLVECKTTSKPYYTLASHTWQKIRREAVKDGLRVPVMVTEIEGVSWAIFNLDSMSFDSLRDECKKISKYPYRGVVGKTKRLYNKFLPCLYDVDVLTGTRERLAIVPYADFLEMTAKMLDD